MRRAFVAATLTSVLAIVVTASAPVATGAAPERSPYHVEDVEVVYLESYPVQVQLKVTGTVPSPCHEPAWTVADDGAFVTVELWSEADPEAFCATVLTESEVIIDVGSYEVARRAVMVDDRLAAFIDVGQPVEGKRLVTAGWSFGMCMGYCRAELIDIDGRLQLTVTDGHAEPPVLRNHGRLTEDGSERLDTVLAPIDPATLEKVYGCPDCADGGAAWIGLLADGQASRHEMPFGEPPAELAELYELTQSFSDALETCVSDELVTVDDDCTPRDER